VPLPPESAVRLWADVRRWPSFVEGFARVVESSPDWPAEGAKVVWESGPTGRGRVTEKVVASDGARLATRVSEERLQGVQRATFAPAPQGSTAAVELEYELTNQGPLRALADVLFIRRAVRDSLRRTLLRFAVEAEEEAGLR
jgi:hypothetical protein